MKKRIISLLLAVSLLITALFVFSSCKDKDNGTENGKESTTDEKKEYSITLVDTSGSPISGAIVTVFKDGEQVKMARADSEGSVKLDFTEGEYTFTLTFTGDESYHYDEAMCKLTEASPSVTVKLAELANFNVELYNESLAAVVDDGTYYVEFDGNAPTYFLYTPTVHGRYKISIKSDVKARCTYNGSALIIYDNDISNESDREVVNGEATGAFFMDFRTYNLNSTQYLFSVSGESAGSGYFTIERVGDLELTPQELPFEEYSRNDVITKFTFSGGNLVNFDISDASLTAVYNENDGYYHLNSEDGPILYVKLTVPNAFTESFEKICETQPFQRYYYDENGNFVKKISFASMMQEYFEAADESSGVYPLNRDLATAITEIGDYLGWYIPASFGESHIFFGETPFYEDTVWLFACCYVDESN